MAKRQATPWDSIGALAFLRDVVGDATEDPRGATLRLRRRPEVATRQWWEIEWTGADGKRHAAEASSLQLLMERAAEVEMAARARLDAEWGEEG